MCYDVFNPPAGFPSELFAISAGMMGVSYGLGYGPPFRISHKMWPIPMIFGPFSVAFELNAFFLGRLRFATTRNHKNSGVCLICIKMPSLFSRISRRVSAVRQHFQPLSGKLPKQGVWLNPPIDT